MKNDQEMERLMSKLTMEQRIEWYQNMISFGVSAVKEDDNGNVVKVIGPGDKEWRNIETTNRNAKPDKRFKRNPRRDRSNRRRAARTAARIIDEYTTKRSVFGAAPEDLEALPPGAEVCDQD